MKKYFPKAGMLAALLFSLFLMGGGEVRAFQISSGPGILTLILRLPQSYEFIRGAPFSIEFHPAVPEAISFPEIPAGHFDPLAEHAKIPFTARAGKVTVKIKATLFYCDKISKLCRQKAHETQLTFEIDPRGSSSPVYIWRIVPETEPK